MLIKNHVKVSLNTNPYQNIKTNQQTIGSLAVVLNYTCTANVGTFINVTVCDAICWARLTLSCWEYQIMPVSHLSISYIILFCIEQLLWMCTVILMEWGSHWQWQHPIPYLIHAFHTLHTHKWDSFTWMLESSSCWSLFKA